MSDSLETILNDLASGEESAAHRLLPLVHDELRRLAARQAARWKPGDSLRPTALVNEAWLRLAGSKPRVSGKAHFLAVAAKAMRSVLIDHARAKQAEKRGGQATPVTLDEHIIDTGGGGVDQVDLLDLEAAMKRLGERDERRARLVELRFFGGLNMDEIAEVLQVSKSTVEKDWVIARTRLARELQAE
ncbi:MAG: ECF-type sigma factor [Acidobacteriota bacterium]